MILHHFTRPELLDAILRDGLKANWSSCNDIGLGEPVVWLTERDTLVPSLTARKMMLGRGILVGPGCSNLPDATVCLRVVIGTHDRKLAHHLSWLGKKHPMLVEEDGVFLWEVGATNWVYFGDIPPSRLTVFKHVPRTKPYWILKTIREDWQTLRAQSVFPPELEAALLDGRDGPPDYVAAMQELGTCGGGGRSTNSPVEAKDAISAAAGLVP
jgi:hypothetical protein